MNSCQQVSSSPWVAGAIVATALGAFTFVVLYAVSTGGAWRDTVFGKHIMTFTAVILTVSLLAVAGLIWGTDWPYRDVVRAVAWGSIAACLWWRVWLLTRAQWHTPERDTSQTTT